jgi:ABC-type maltose transport system permease subunit
MDIVDRKGFAVTSPQYRRQMKKCMVVAGCCSTISVVAIVMETFALLALQFCDGEDLMMLYWSTWTMLQIGSVIAIFGVMLHIIHSLRGRKHP